MKKILIIGNAGAGKTTFSHKLSKMLGIPVIHLDKLYWSGCWEHRDKAEFDELLDAELLKDEWIIDGNYNRTLPYRLKFCDAVFFFDFSPFVCLWGVTKRVIQSYGKTRSDMGGECPEFFDKQKIGLYKNVLKYNKNNRSRYYELLKNTNAQVVVFKNRKDVKRYIDKNKSL